MSRILVLGGYGGFGGRISRRLAEAGYCVLVAGRSPSKAVAFCKTGPGLLPIVLDRENIAEALVEHSPDLVVDASGPFQEMDLTIPAHASLRAYTIATLPTAAASSRQSLA